MVRQVNKFSMLSFPNISSRFLKVGYRFLKPDRRAPHKLFARECIDSIPDTTAAEQNIAQHSGRFSFRFLKKPVKRRLHFETENLKIEKLESSASTICLLPRHSFISTKTNRNVRNKNLAGYEERVPDLTKLS